MKTVLVVAAHPDDEALGCGGTILKYISIGYKIHCVFMTDGISARLKVNKKYLNKRKLDSKIAQSLLGISSTTYLKFPDNKMDTIALLDIIQKLEPIINKIKPEIVFTHHYGDLNVDHKLTHAAVMTACRPSPSSSVREIYGFEVLSSTEWSTAQQNKFNPTFFVDITKQISTKINVLKAYNSEMRPQPHSRSIEHVKTLAKHRGYSLGVSRAEAFEVYRVMK